MIDNEFNMDCNDEFPDDIYDLNKNFIEFSLGLSYELNSYVYESLLV